MLNASGHAKLTVSHHGEFNEFTFHVLGVVEKIVEVAADRLGARVLQWRNEVIKDDVVFIEATERSELVGAGGRDTLMLEVDDLLLGADSCERMKPKRPRPLLQLRLFQVKVRIFSFFLP